MDLSEAAISPAEQAQQAAQWGDGPNTRVPMAEAIAAKFRRNGYRFVPLVCEDFSLLCSLDICSYGVIFHSASSALVILITG